MRLLIITQKVDEHDEVLGFFVYWIRALAARVDEVRVIGLAKGTYSLPQNVTVVSLGKEHGTSKMVQALRFYYYLFKFLPTTDGVFVHMAPEYVRALYPFNIFFYKPIVMWYAHIKVSKVAAWAIKHVNFVCTPSKESFEYDSPKIIATGHGINTELFTPQDVPEEATLMTLSRISRVKRIETLIEAVRILKAWGHGFHTDIYGAPARPEDDAYLDDLKLLVSKYDLESCIHWKQGTTSTDPAIYARHKVFIRMQGGGGFGKTELEAMSMGVPAIVPTPVYKNDLSEWADDLYFPEDDAQALADRIKQVLLWSTERREAYSKAARALVVNKHNVEHVAEKIVTLLRSCVA